VVRRYTVTAQTRLGRHALNTCSQNANKVKRWKIDRESFKAAELTESQLHSQLNAAGPCRQRGTVAAVQPVLPIRLR